MHKYLVAIFLVFLTHTELLPASGQTKGCGGFDQGLNGGVQYETQDESESEICIWVLLSPNASKIELTINELLGGDNAVGIHWNVHKPAEGLESLIVDSSNLGQNEQISSEIVVVVLHRTGPVTLSLSWQAVEDEEEWEGQFWGMLEDPTDPNPGEGKYSVKPVGTSNLFHILKWQEGPSDYTIDLGEPQHCPDSSRCECLSGSLFKANEDGGLVKIFSVCSPYIASGIASVRGPLLAFGHGIGNSTDSGLTLAWRKRRPEEATTDNSTDTESTSPSAGFKLEASIMLNSGRFFNGFILNYIQELINNVT